MDATTVARELMAQQNTILLGPFLLAPDELTRRRAYQTAGIPVEGRWAFDRKVVACIAEEAREQFSIRDGFVGAFGE